MNNFKSNTILAKAGITFRGKAVPVPEPEPEPENEMWVILDVTASSVIGGYRYANTIFDKMMYLNSNSNYLDDVFVTIIDHNNNDSTVDSSVLSRDPATSDEEMVQFLIDNGFTFDPLKTYFSVLQSFYHLSDSAYWYGEQLDKYLNNTELDFNGKTFRQYSADDVLPQYDEWFNLDNHILHVSQLRNIEPRTNYTVNDTNNTAYGIGGQPNKYNSVAFLSIGWACKMTQSEYNNWKFYANNSHVEHSYLPTPYVNIGGGHGYGYRHEVHGAVWFDTLQDNRGTLYVVRTQVINGTLLR